MWSKFETEQLYTFSTLVILMNGLILAMLARMRAQLAHTLSTLPNINNTADGIFISPIGDLGKGNTTSVTKVQ